VLPSENRRPRKSTGIGDAGETCTASPPPWSLRAAALLVLAFLLISSIYGVTTPPWEAPDEVGHMGYVTHLVKTRTLPVQRIGDLGQAHQPPLYYLLSCLTVGWVDLGDPSGHFHYNRNALLAGAGEDVNVALHNDSEHFPYRGEALGLHVARLVSTLLGAATV